MTEIERKALALLQDCGFHGGYIDRKWNEQYEALCRAIERIEELEAIERDYQGCDYAKPLMELQAEFEAFKREVSDAVEHYLDQWRHSTPSREVFACQFGSFILPKPVNPLVEAWLDAFPGNHIDDAREECAKISAALAARGLEIREKQP